MEEKIVVVSLIHWRRCNRISITQISTQLDATINPKIYCFVAQTLLNMFRALQCPSSGALQTAVAASGFLMNTETRGCNGSLTGS